MPFGVAELEDDVLPLHVTQIAQGGAQVAGAARVVGVGAREEQHADPGRRGLRGGGDGEARSQADQQGGDREAEPGHHERPASIRSRRGAEQATVVSPRAQAGSCCSSWIRLPSGSFSVAMRSVL